jgi:serine/threonine protein kinase/Tfp pilus assembly protein PilF
MACSKFVDAATRPGYARKEVSRRRSGENWYRAMANESQLGELLLRWEELRERGQPVSPDELCRGCPELLSELKRRVAALESLAPLVGGSESRSWGPAPVSTVTDVPGAASASPGGVISGGLRYRLERFHARGGLGEVYVAYDETLHREVALKRIRGEPAGDTDSLSRFVVEAEVTGRLEHPGVVPVYGLGEDSEGRPFYAMRFVRGETLHDAAQRFHERDTPDREPGERTLALRQLLAQFVAVCNAVAYAHSRGILHRDLKPANVLLGPYGETLVVDWGLAKQTRTAEGAESAEEEKGAGICPLSSSAPSASSAVSSPDTLPGQSIGTPGFMSPEQAAGAWDRVGPASDIYSLGATLYFLLTGKSPFPTGGVAERLFRAQMGHFPQPRRVKSSVPAALDAVCQKALALQPADRFATALELAADVEHWLAAEPVSAYPEPWPLRLRRWARRHPAVLAAVAALVLTALAGLALGLAAVRAEQRLTLAERDRAEEASGRATAQAARAGALNQFLLEDLLGAAAPERNARDKQVTVEQVLDKAAGKVEKGFPGQPEVEGDVRMAIGETYYRLGRLDRAEPQLENALRLRTLALGPDHPETLDAVNDLALVRKQRGKLAEAEPLYRQNLDARRRVLGSEHPDTLLAINNLASLLAETGKLADAEQLFRENLEARRRTGGAEGPQTLVAANNLAVVLAEEGKLEEAAELYRQTLQTRMRLLGADHPDTVLSAHNLGAVLQSSGRLAEAEPLLRQNLEARRRVLGPEHFETLQSLNSLAGLLKDRGKLDEAERLLQEGLSASRRVLGPDHPDTLRTMNNLAGALEQAGKRTEAETLAREALTRGRRVLPPDHPSLLGALGVLGAVLNEAGKPQESETLLRECLAGRRKTLPAHHWRTAQTEVLLGTALMAQQRYAEAEPLLRGAAEVLRAGPGVPESQRRKALDQLIQLYEAWGRSDDAAFWRRQRDENARPEGRSP